MRQLLRKEMRLTDRQGAVLCNLGAIISYVSLVMLLLDALHVAKHHEVVSLDRKSVV